MPVFFPVLFIFFGITCWFIYGGIIWFMFGVLLTTVIAKTIGPMGSDVRNINHHEVLLFILYFLFLTCGIFLCIKNDLLLALLWGIGA